MPFPKVWMSDTQSLTESFLVLLYFDAMFPTINRGEPRVFNPEVYRRHGVFIQLKAAEISTADLSNYFLFKSVLLMLG